MGRPVPRLLLVLAVAAVLASAVVMTSGGVAEQGSARHEHAATTTSIERVSRARGPIADFAHTPVTPALAAAALVCALAFVGIARPGSAGRALRVRPALLGSRSPPLRAR
jgi:hypothetical protein